MLAAVDAIDLELVDAVQLEPRAPWRTVAARTGLSEATAARRWKRLHQERLVWTGAALHPAASKGAFIEVRCRIKNLEDLSNALMEIPDVVTVGHSTGVFNLFCIVVGISLDAVLARVELGLPGFVRSESVRVNLFHEIAGGVDWRQGLLADILMHHIEHSSASVSPRLEERPLLLALSENARISSKRAARAIGATPASVSRRIAQLEERRHVVFRCDVARPAFDYPIAMMISLKVQPLLARKCAVQVGQWREVRFCASVASSANVIVVAGLRDLPDGERFIARLLQSETPVEIVERSTITRMSKVYGRLLDRDGRARGHVPTDPWAALELRE